MKKTEKMRLEEGRKRQWMKLFNETRRREGKERMKQKERGETERTEEKNEYKSYTHIGYKYRSREVGKIKERNT